MKLDQLHIKKWLKILLINVLIIFLAFLLAYTTFFENLELKSLDVRFHLRGEVPEPDTSIVLVAIDDQTFKGLQKTWPFPREYYARLIKNLREAGALLIVLDIIFSEADLIHSRADSILAESIAMAGNVVLAGKMVYELGNRSFMNSYLMRPLPMLERAALNWGLVNVPEDPDGFVRRYLLFQNHNGRHYYTLALAVLNELMFVSKSSEIQNYPGYLKVNEKKILKYNYNTMLINFQGATETFNTYSFVNILDDSTFHLPGDEDTNIFEYHKKSRTFDGKIVFVGASSEEILQDNKLTPFFEYGPGNQKTPGMEVHANALSTILAENYIKRISLFPVLLLILIFNTVVGYIARIWVPVVLPVSSLLLCYGENVIRRVVMERREKGRYRRTFEHYVAHNVVDTMLKKGELPRFGGERKELTVLFSDIRAFSTFSEKYPPDMVVNQLSEYLTRMTDIIFSNKGTLDKFVGDEIMALYGAPYFYKEHAYYACKTAFEMIHALHRLHEEWAKNNLEGFDIGIGINTGKVIVGNLGSRQLFDYTVIGDEVNLGARLEGANKQYMTSIILSESTYRQTKDKVIVRELDFVRVKGKNNPVKIYELLGLAPLPDHEHHFLIEIYTKGLRLYQQRQWYPALTEFRRVLRHFPTDGPARVYTVRCLNYLVNPPPDDWDGVFVFSTK